MSQPNDSLVKYDEPVLVSTSITNKKAKGIEAEANKKANAVVNTAKKKRDQLIAAAEAKAKVR